MSDQPTQPEKGGSSRRYHGSAVDLLAQLVTKRAGGEDRPQQRRMTELVEEHLDRGESVVVQAGTGTGKSLAYLAPLAARHDRAVIATYTRQLSEQLARVDLPALVNTVGQMDGGTKLTWALLKGRENYLCRRETAELNKLDEQEKTRAGMAGDPAHEQESLFGDDDGFAPPPPPAKKAPGRPVPAVRHDARDESVQLRSLLAWEKTTKTGDRAEENAPVVNDHVWSQVSVNAAGCTGSACPFYRDCFTEKARNRARKADLVVTNHAVLALDLESERPVLGEWDVLVVDEAHELVDSLTSAWAFTIDLHRWKDSILSAWSLLEKDDREDKVGYKKDLDALIDDVRASVESIPTGTVTTVPERVQQDLETLVVKIAKIATLLLNQSGAPGLDEKVAGRRRAATNTLRDMCDTIHAVLSADLELSARWAEEKYKSGPIVLKAALLDPGAKFADLVAGRPVVATSATLSLGDDFTVIVKSLGLPDGTTGVDVGTPFDYQRSILHISDPATFPTYSWDNKEVHEKAVTESLEELIAAAGGRTLALFSTSYAAARNAELLRETFPGLNVYADKEAPAGALADWFAKDETSVLCATLGMWQGLDVRGRSCVLVAIDKMAFAPASDPLMSARRARLDKMGRDGWSEVFLADANRKIAQAAGRLNRDKNDQGVVAVFEPRLWTARYGQKVVRSLPNFYGPVKDQSLVTRSLMNLTGGPHPYVFDASARPERLGALPRPHKDKWRPDRRGGGTSRSTSSTRRTRSAADTKKAAFRNPKESQ